MIYFTSDTHFGHKNIVKGTTSWTSFKEGSSHQGVRDFDTLEEHNYTLIKHINEKVGYSDTLYHLGDWSFGGKENIQKFREQLACNDIHLIFGNHDQHIEPLESPFKSLFSSCSYYKELSINKQRFVLLHYGMRVWNKSHHGSIHLYGHSHGTLPSFGRSMDVGVDTNNLYPYSIEEIIKILPETSPIVDHHNKNTN